MDLDNGAVPVLPQLAPGLSPKDVCELVCGTYIQIGCCMCELLLAASARAVCLLGSAMLVDG